MGVKVFLHVCAINHALRVAEEMMKALHYTGVYEMCDGIYCFLVGSPDLIPEVRALLQSFGDKVRVVAEAPHDTSYERFTILKIHEHVQPEDVIIYMHSKTVQYTPIEKYPPIRDWFFYLLHMTLHHHKIILQKLQHEGYHVAGCNYNTLCRVNPKHFSGNFWWARGDYFLSLPHVIGPNYYDPEFYLCQMPHKPFVIHTTGMDHHYVEYPPSSYIDYIPIASG